jgi:phospholipid N-methyltransferase
MQQRWADYRVFWQQFRRAYNTTGAVLPSGQALAAALCRYVRDGEAALAAGQTGVARPRRILEVGPGTGAVTGRILCDMRSDDRLTLVERNSEFVARLRERMAQDAAYHGVVDRVSIVHAGVEDLPENEPYDVVISGLPLNNFTAEAVEGILGKIRRLLSPAGTLSFFEYIAIRRFQAAVGRQADRQRVREIADVLGQFLKQSEIRRDAIWANMPPAWVHHVRFGNRMW